MRLATRRIAYGFGGRKTDDPDPRLPHLARPRALHLRRPEGVEHHVALDSLLGSLGDRLRDLAGDLAPPVDVGLDVERLARRRAIVSRNAGKMQSPLISSSTSVAAR